METLIDWMPVASMLLFIGIFALVLLYVVTDRRRGHLQRMAAAALDEDEEGADRG